MYYVMCIFIYVNGLIIQYINRIDRIEHGSGGSQVKGYYYYYYLYILLDI